MNKLLVLLSTLVLGVFFSLAANAQADKIVGKWQSIDEKTDKAKSIIRIYKSNGKYYGKIDQLLNKKPGEENPNCKHCGAYDGKYKTSDNKTVGLELIKDLEYDADDNEWTDGTIFDPEEGKEYTCSMEIIDGKLNVRGSLDPWGIAGRTQIWLPVK